MYRFKDALQPVKRVVVHRAEPQQHMTTIRAGQIALDVVR